MGSIWASSSPSPRQMPARDPGRSARHVLRGVTVDVGLYTTDVLEVTAGSEIPVNIRGGKDTSDIFWVSLKRFLYKLNDAFYIKEF